MRTTPLTEAEIAIEQYLRRQADQGFVMVPRVPTDEMLAAAKNAIKAEIERTPPAQRGRRFLKRFNRKGKVVWWVPAKRKAIARYQAMVDAAEGQAHELV